MGLKTSVPIIRSLTRSPISFIQLLTLSRSRAGGQVAVCSVVCSSFFMYARSKSESNDSRGDGAEERGLEGERIPVGEIIVVRK